MAVVVGAKGEDTREGGDTGMAMLPKRTDDDAIFLRER